MALYNQCVIYTPGHISTDSNNVGHILVGERQLFDIRCSTVTGICTDASGNVFMSDPHQHVILKVTPYGQVRVYAGHLGISGNNGSNTVSGVDAYFNYPMGINCDPQGNVYVADSRNNQIRMITQDGVVRMVAGDESGASGFTDGIGSAALFDYPNDVSVDRSGNIFVADTNNHAIRRITSWTAGVLTVAGDGVAGDGYRVRGSASNNGRLRSPQSIACTPSGTVYVFDTGNRKIKLWNTSFDLLRFSGSGNSGYAIGNADVCEYNNLSFSDVDNTGNIYVIDYSGDNSRLLKVNPNGISAVIKDFAGEVLSKYTVGVAVNHSGTVYVTESEYIYLQSSSSSSSVELSSSSSSS